MAKPIQYKPLVYPAKIDPKNPPKEQPKINNAITFILSEDKIYYYTGQFYPASKPGPKGPTVFEETNFGRLLYFNKDSSLQWQYVNRADNGNVYYVIWSRILNKPEDIKKVRKIVETEN